MAIQVAVTHRTEYKYDRPVALGPQVIRLRPASHTRTPVLSYSLKISPAQHILHWQQDPHGNHVARVLVLGNTDALTIDVELLLELTPVNPFDFFIEPGAEEFPFAYRPELARDLDPFLAQPLNGPLLDSFVAGISREKLSTVAFLVALNHRVRDNVAYVTRPEHGIQTCEETLGLRRGSCRDSSWLLVQVLRRLGLAGRFVSGYLIQSDSDGRYSADLHAWAEVFIPGGGWIGLDPTSGLLAGEGHIPLACTPDASNAAPITGTVGPAEVEFSHALTVRRVGGASSTSAPISDGEWAKVERLATQIDRDLSDMDVRLTMGGEPTFVGLDEPDSPQWNGDAMGPLKRNRAASLIRMIREQIAPGALLHYGQGKWYPGEPLPRWALSCFWRADGVPVWENLNLIAEEDAQSAYTTGDAANFINALTRRLQVSRANVIPAFEDTFYYVWRERRLPVNVEVSDSKLLNAREREELARVFERGLSEPVGYVLPIRRREHNKQRYWSSELWFLRPDRLLLIQGDSPLGFRLPLESLPWVAPDEVEYEYDVDPFADREKLPERPLRLPHLFDVEPESDPQAGSPAADTTGKPVTRPALCVEARDGRLHVFLPYLTKVVDYVDLIAGIEDTCAHLKMPVWIEGYTPPSDPRLHSFSVTPDPGVVEVNLPPSKDWVELQRINTLVFDEARKNRLTAEKFAYDGAHTATGGGNHIVLGGATADDSPLLRRPDLLRSMLCFWQHHPSLSYLFSGRFVGPTSQHPRIDEARMDSLYELEIAFAQLPDHDCPPWLVDRLFRNILVDMTGNTHRAEFCIDKLYPPQGSGSRLGLLELRAFEMAPHVRMCLTELLLVRALVAMFWKSPYEGRLIRWGTSLHDRFLLPHFVWQDFIEVLSALHRGGYALSPEWFGAQFDFRFPKIGSVSGAGVKLELTQALEPWHVLGEEGTPGGTVRNVDSSLDRLQVKVSGLTSDSSYVVTCNGRRVPLHPTGIPGEFVAGVRYRAWKPTSCLHPTIPVHTPLVFDIVSVAAEHSVARCTYHVGAQYYTARPANAVEAESRRRDRFQSSGNTFGPMKVPSEELNPNSPLTLDLRWPRPESPPAAS